ncbi:hypothetical protein MJO29_005296 [Puccinia striiformis f. sp. tritici]|nr:hypothetical protein MJO29_005296 [Puccinia striiformis f. sp. tritici]
MKLSTFLLPLVVALITDYHGMQGSVSAFKIEPVDDATNPTTLVPELAEEHPDVNSDRQPEDHNVASTSSNPPSQATKSDREDQALPAGTEPVPERRDDQVPPARAEPVPERRDDQVPPARTESVPERRDDQVPPAASTGPEPERPNNARPRTRIPIRRGSVVIMEEIYPNRFSGLHLDRWTIFVVLTLQLQILILMKYRLPQGLEAHYGTAPMEEDDENRYEETCTIDQGISEEGARHMDHPIDDDDDDDEEEDQMAPPIEEDEEDQDDAMAELAYDGANQYTTTYDGHQRARNIATRNRNNATEEMAHPEKEHQDDLVHDEDDDQVLEEDQEEDVVDEEQDEEDEDEQLEEEEEEEEEESGELQEEEDEEEDDESVDNRTDAELAAIALELQDLEESVPLLKTSYHLLDRLGEGTFSSVYKAIDLHHHLYDNSLWAPEEEAVIEPPQMVSSDARFHPSTSTSSCSGSVMGDQSYRSTLTSSHQNTGFPSHHPLADDDPFEASAGDQARNKFTETLQRHALESGKLPTAYKSINNDDPHNTLKPKKKNSHVYVALKRIYVTSSPFRIMNELKLLAELRDAEHVAYLIQAIRHEDQVIAVMPYRKHQDFREYYRTASIGTMRNYLRCLFSALKDTHSRGIIHRDIKPANFLFDIDTQTGVLCDFGLAEKFDPYDWYGKCLHSLPEPKNACNFHGKLLSKPKSTYDQMEEQWKRWRSKLLKFRTEFLYNLGRPLLDLNELTDTIEWKELFKLRPFDSQPNQTDLTNQVSYEWYQSWKPVTKVGGLWGGGYGKRKNPSATNSGSTSNVDNMIIDRVGFKKEDGRPSAKANRAGTRGFRAPEVLFKCPDQTGAIDIWSVGVTLLCFLTRRFPFFNSNDDVDALMEIATIFGRSKLESVALHHNRTVISNIPEVNGPRFSSLHTLVRTLNPTIYEEQRLEHAERTGGGTSTGLSGKSAPVGMDESRIDRLTNTIFQAHRELSSSVETLGQDLNPYNEPWYLRSELWYLVDLLKRTLELDCTKRITAAHALRHKFFVLFE